LNLLSHKEIEGLLASDEVVFKLFRECALAVLVTGSETADADDLFEDCSDFDIKVIPQSRGIKLEVMNAPATAFVDGVMIKGIGDHLFAALRDILYVNHEIYHDQKFDLQSSEGITDAVFRILRNANIVRTDVPPNLVVCWGGHSIPRDEYDYSKEVGYQLGLRALNIGTGCGTGAMKGPMKGAAVGHAKQQFDTKRYIGISEPGIIASEPPNPIVNELVIMPDIEKRLEAFVRLAHCIIVFPGGVGTVEEVLYILSLLMHPANQQQPLSMIFAAPNGRHNYFQILDSFIRHTLGTAATRHYTIINGNPEEVGKQAKEGVVRVRKFRRKTDEAYGYNWRLHIDPILQFPFTPSHENVAQLRLDKSLQPFELAAQLRCAFSAIVSGNVKTYGIEQIRKRGPYQINGDPDIMGELDTMLQAFVKQRRMKVGKGKYVPSYEIVS
jgi:predicted Rossmann-fold nucleotide-binding protein